MNDATLDLRRQYLAYGLLSLVVAGLKALLLPSSSAHFRRSFAFTA